MASSKPKLSLCMIVKNEALFLEECLTQAKAFCDEMIVVDTGSSDDSMVLANSCGAKTYAFAWCDDFSAARNHSLAQASGDWILVLDADERMSSQDWKGLIELIQNSQFDCYDLNQINYVSQANLAGFLPNQSHQPGFENYPGYTISSLVRLFRRDSLFRFEGLVHEHLYQAGKVKIGQSTDLNIHHHGQSLSAEKMLEKKKNYLKIGLKKAQALPNDFKVHHELGIAYWELGDLPQAQASLQKAHECNAQSMINLIALGSVLQIQGQYQAALDYLQLAVQIDPQHPSIHAALGNVYLASAQEDKAIACYQKQIQINPEYEQTRLWLSQAYASRRVKNPAVKPTISVCYIVKNEADCLEKTLLNVKPHVDEVIVLDTGSTDQTREIAIRNGAKVFHATWKNDFSWARNQSFKHATGEWILVLDADEVLGQLDWQNLKKLTQDNLHLMYFLNQTTYSNASTFLHWTPNNLNYSESKGYEGYFESYLVRFFKNTSQIKFTGAVHEHAHHDDPSVQPVAVNIRIHHYGKFRGEERMKQKGDLYYQIGLKKLKEMPDEPQAYFEMAVQLLEFKKYDEAIGYFEKCLSLNPDYEEAQITYASILHFQKKYSEALNVFAKLIDKNPKNPRIFIFASSILIELQKFELAQTLLNKAKELGAGDSMALLLNEGVINLNYGFYDLAEASFQKACQLNQSFAPALINLGFVAIKKNQIDQAEVYLKKAIAIVPDDKGALRILGDILFNKGERESALQLYKKALEGDEQNSETLYKIILTSHALHKSDCCKFEEQFFTSMPSSNLVDLLLKFYRQVHEEKGMLRLFKFLESHKQIETE